MDAASEIKSRLNIEDVIGTYLELKRAGRNFKALSPFTSEKTPSFIVSPEKGIWHDFSSNKGGDVISFIMEIEGMTFREALELLANKAGVDLKMFGGGADLSKKRKKLLEINQLACKFYQSSLTKNKHAVEYVFYKRNFNRQTATDFCLGYAPNTGSALTSFLLGRGYTKKDLADAGLTNRFGTDLFKSRMMIPLMDQSGNVIGFTGRIIDADPKAPKYLNTPETILYNKSRHVFGLSQAKEAIRKSDQAVLVEGNLDVISSHQAGIRQVVATAGTAMTDEHLKSISKFSPNLRLAYDADKAGVAAAERAIKIAARLGVELSVISGYDDAKDPDELIQKDPALWQQAIDNYQPAVDWLLGVYEAKLDLASAAGKKKYSTVALDLINNLPDPVEKEHYFNLVSEKLHSTVDALKNKLEGISEASSGRSKPKKGTNIKPGSQTASDRENALQDTILALGLYDKSLQKTFENLNSADFHGENRQKILKIIQNSGKDVDFITTELDTYIQVLKLRAETRYASWDKQEFSKELDLLLSSLRDEKRENQKSSLVAEIKDAELMGDDVKVAELQAELQKYIK